MKITAVVVTKGDRDISQVTQSLSHFDELIVWNNSRTPKDLMVFGRYAAAFIARNEHIYIQDDDCLIDTNKLLVEYENSSKIFEVFSNFPKDRRQEYAETNITLLGWGSIFHKSTLGVFDEYLSEYPFDELFLRECDRVFSHQASVLVTDVGVTHLPYAYGDDRMGKENRHREDFMKICKRLRSL